MTDETRRLKNFKEMMHMQQKRTLKIFQTVLLGLKCFKYGTNPELPSTKGSNMVIFDWPHNFFEGQTFSKVS